MRRPIIRNGGQIGRFLVVGGLSVCTYYALFIGLTEWVGMWYIASAAIAFVAYYALQFTLQKYWAFQNHSTTYVRRQLLQFTTLAVVNWCVNTVLLYIAVQYFGANYIVAQIVLTIAVSIVAYILFSRIFRNH